MINHLSVGVADLARTRKFYDAALKPLDITVLSDSTSAIGYGKSGIAAFWTLAVKSPVAPDADSGLHICFDAPTRAAVDRFHAAALEHGGTSNGKPGLRPDYGPGYYAAFIIDPDGYRIEAYCAGD